MIDVRMRTFVSDEELALKEGRILTDGDYNLKVTGPARLRKPDGSLLAVYLPGAMTAVMREAWPTLARIRLMTDNRGKASGTERERRGDQKRSRTRRVMSTVVGFTDPGPAAARTAGRLPVCRTTAWTGSHLPEWDRLRPLFVAIDRGLQEHVQDRWQAQQRAAERTHPDWIIPGTTFTTATINNTYSTGVHVDAGDLVEGFGTLAVARAGAYTGGDLVLARYRVAFDMQDGDLLLFDVHEPHGNTNMRCAHQDAPLAKPCPQGCERVSVVAYYRTKMAGCASAAEEAARAVGAVRQ